MNRLVSILRLTLFLALAGFCFGSTPALSRNSDRGDEIESVRLGDLPPEARATLVLIKQGGPFPYPRKDGSTFGNFEKRLPERPRNYYREYTVPTPGSRDRGARRIVAGSGRTGNVANSGEYYYSHDHYRSFRRIQE
ncbi:MAG: ribonuclease domain-containing protein [Propionivibrio sp.]